MKEDIIVVQNVTRLFDKQRALTDITMNMVRGEIFGLLGPSGAGKTTLVKQIVGLEYLPTKGVIQVFQEKMPSLKVIQRIGYMAQSDALYGELKGKENLEFFGALYGLKGKRLQNRINEVLEVVE